MNALSALTTFGLPSGTIHNLFKRELWTDPHASYITDEVAWRSAGGAVGQDLVVARWVKDPRYASMTWEATHDCFVIEINLRRTETELQLDGRPLFDGILTVGAVQITPPGREMAGRFSNGADQLHIFVPSNQVRAVVGDSIDLQTITVGPPKFDAVVERLAWSLLKIAELPPSLARPYGDGIAAAIVARVASRQFTRNGGAPFAVGLVKWRLNRVLRFIDERLSGPISLPDLAASAGLSRMHFAAQFRAATGMRPHDYILRRRVDCAQELLLNTHLPLVEVALSVGFQTQAHFTTVFRSIVADSPGRWRQRMLSSADPSKSVDVVGFRAIMGL